MKRALVLGTVVMAGVLAAAITSLVAQQPPAGRGGGRGGGGGVGAIEQVADNVYMIPGAGGNTGVLVTAKGVVLVDTKLANNGQAILDQVQTVTTLPVTHIINTHTHGDHNGSNVFFPASVEIVAHANTAANMKRMPVFQEAANQHGLPDRTYTDRLTMLDGADAIDLYYFGPAHTDGDALVVFRDARVMHTGDMFPQKGQPFIDRGNGGSGVAFGDTIGKAAAGISNVERVITGHSTAMSWQDFVDYGEFNRLFLAHARESLQQGKSPEQAMMDLRLPEKFSDYQLTGGRGGAGGNFGVLFEELQQR